MYMARLLLFPEGIPLDGSLEAVRPALLCMRHFLLGTPLREYRGWFTQIRPGSLVGGHPACWVAEAQFLPGSQAVRRLRRLQEVR